MQTYSTHTRTRTSGRVRGREAERTSARIGLYIYECNLARLHNRTCKLAEMRGGVAADAAMLPCALTRLQQCAARPAAFGGALVYS